MCKGEMMTHIRHLAGLVVGLALVGCTMEDSGQSSSKRANVASGDAVILAAHHHHKRGSNCEHGQWATTENAGHHHHKRGRNCGHGVWATSSVGGHHHHKRGDDCVHGKWATSDQFADTGFTALDEMVTEETFSDDPSVPYDLSSSDLRSYEEVEAELAAMEQTN